MLLGTYNEAFLPARTCKYNKNRKYAKKNKKKLSCKIINNLATLLPTFLFNRHNNHLLRHKWHPYGSRRYTRMPHHWQNENKNAKKANYISLIVYICNIIQQKEPQARQGIMFFSRKTLIVKTILDVFAYGVYFEKPK